MVPSHKHCHALLVISMMLSCCLLVPKDGNADEVHLNNGDRISGQILKKEDGTVSIKTTYAGTIFIKWQDVSRIVTENPVAVYLKNETLVEVNEMSAEQPEQSGPGAAISIFEVKYINPPPYITGKGILWSGHVNAGYVANDGNSPKARLNIDGQVTARTKKKRYTLAGSYLFAKEEGVETESKIKGLGKVDHFFNSKWYGTAQVAAEKDRFKDIKLRTISGAGVGYQFWESKNLNLSVESGVDYVVEDYIDSPDDEYPAFRWALNFDKFLVPERLQAFHNHQLNVSLEDSDDLLFTSQTGLRMLFLTNLNAVAEIDYDYDNNPADDTKRADTTYKFSVGYFW